MNDGALDSGPFRPCCIGPWFIFMCQRPAVTKRVNAPSSPVCVIAKSPGVPGVLVIWLALSCTFFTPTPFFTTRPVILAVFSLATRFNVIVWPSAMSICWRGVLYLDPLISPVLTITSYPPAGTLIVKEPFIKGWPLPRPSCERTSTWPLEIGLPAGSTTVPVTVALAVVTVKLIDFSSVSGVSLNEICCGCSKYTQSAAGCPGPIIGLILTIQVPPEIIIVKAPAESVCALANAGIPILLALTIALATAEPSFFFTDPLRVFAAFA